MSPTQKEAEPIAGKSTDEMLNKSDPIESSDGHNISGASTNKKSTKKKKLKSSSSHKKAKRDPNKPEYPKVGYVRYMNVRREELRKEAPDMYHLEVTKKIGEEWMTLSDEKKQPYLDAAKQDKIRYKLEMKAYNKKMRKAEHESTSPSKSKKKSPKTAKDANTSASTVDESPKKKKKKNTPSTGENQTNTSNLESSQKPKAQNASKMAKQQPAASSISLMNTPPPTPPHIDSNGAPIFGDIPIFTDKFLEHNRQLETELKKIRKMNTDYEQQNAVLEKHVENVRTGVDKTNAEITDFQKQNEKLEAYLDTLRQRLSTQLRNLSIPGEPNGANIDNIDKYMNDLYEMAKDNSHGPASLNKAKDLLRKVDLNIDLKEFHKDN